MTMLDLGPATRQMAALLNGVTDDQLTAPTPCADLSLGALIDHVSGLSVAFTAAAHKDLDIGSQAPSPDASRLQGDWRERIGAELVALEAAWHDPQAWEGMTRAGGLDLPGEVAGLVALDELVIHGWDVARASGQPFDVDQVSLEAAMTFVSQTPDDPAAREGLFGPVVPVPDDAPLLDRVIGLSGRQPAWAAG